MRSRYSEVGRVLAVAGILAAAAFVPGCDVSDRLLKATDPDPVNPNDVQSADGAEGVRVGAMDRWKRTTGGPYGNGSESTWMFGGLLVDEWGTGSTFVQNDQVDKRATPADNGTVTTAFRALNRVRTAVNQAIPLLIKWRPNDTALNTKIAELLLARAYAEMQLASDFCNGIPLSDASALDGTIIEGDPMTIDQVFTKAIATADSGIGLATATDTGTVNILNALKVIKARAQLGLNQVAAAGALAATVPTTFVYNHTFSTNAGTNSIWSIARSNRRYLVGDSIEGNARNILVANAIPFFSAQDNRLPAKYTIATVGGRPDTTKSQDGLTLSRTTDLYDETTSIPVASGIDARLIEAEAALAAGNVNGANGLMPILNALRGTARSLGTVTTSPAALPALADPGTTTLRQNLLFREWAFWTFSRGQRLGVMRRLVRYYGRASTSVYPEGPHYRGGVYGTDLQLPIPADELYNSKSKGCTDRNA
jgi:hypothetical protein